MQGVILRAAQPLLGKHGRCYEDERLFRSILECTTSDKGVIVDTRSAADAASHKSKVLLSLPLLIFTGRPTANLGVLLAWEGRQ